MIIKTPYKNHYNNNIMVLKSISSDHHNDNDHINNVITNNQTQWLIIQQTHMISEYYEINNEIYNLLIVDLPGDRSCAQIL